MITVSELWQYPFKSGKGISLPFCHVDNEGMIGDRRLMAVDNTGQFVTARQHPQLLQLSCLNTDNGWLLSHPESSDSFFISFERDETIQIKGLLWDDKFNGLDAGNNAAAWLSHALKLDVRVALWKNESRVSGKYQLQTTFSDGAPLLLTTQESLVTIANMAGITPDMRRFRPNIVVSGSEAFSEFNWKELRIGNLTFSLLDACARCVLTTRDPDSGEAHPKMQPLRALKKQSTNKQGEPIFGVNVKLVSSLSTDQSNTTRPKDSISVGDQVTLL
jgi:uncharacterized protein YcbX